MSKLKKSECKAAIEQLAHEWLKTQPPLDVRKSEGLYQYPSFLSFQTWLHDQGYGIYLDFRSQYGALNEAEGWFEAILKPVWRRP